MSWIDRNPATAAATDSMAVLTGVEGRYDAQRGACLAPEPNRTWEDVVLENRLKW